MMGLLDYCRGQVTSQRCTNPANSKYLNIFPPTGDKVTPLPPLLPLQVLCLVLAPGEADGEDLLVAVLDEGGDGAGREADEQEVVAPVSHARGVPVGVHDQVLQG